MQLSLDQCRQQVAIHLDRAANETLDNVRRISLRAAQAWEREADLAEKRDKRRQALIQSRAKHGTASNFDAVDT
ncbi:hypothetical protein GRI97_15845 [Altererythrobacter xixiisoli]|uniref:Uncharacterized protein n=1 Tax=Croceibacterium xixiisoli TaxID=1476466 RepID=A0A6I4TX41_9SPHN|nr:hypothetical protein [Croceibacterium xixiisoli]MXP00463.1 hypothetical protein [Croceibacterium xixiisoli]